jgi:hypothetical protein
MKKIIVTMRVELEVSEDISVNDNIFTTINDELSQLITGEEGYLDIEDTSDEYNYDCVKFKVKSSTVIAGV